jgi:hypothetical protein
MVPRASQRQEDLAAFGLTLILAVWIGGSAVVDAAVVPSAFEMLPRGEAADLGATLFHRWNFVEGIAGILTVFLATTMGRGAWGSPRRHMTATAILLAMTLLVLGFLFLLTPAITSRLTELKEANVDLANPQAMPPTRREMHTLHTIYAALDVAKILAGFTVMWLLATKRPR